MQNQVQELFAPPIGLQPINISGTTLYTSDKLKERFILAFEKSSKGRHISNDIARLVNNNKIVPCFKSKGLFSFLRSRIMGDPDRNIAGFFDIDEQHIVVMIDNHSTIFGTSSNNVLASTTIHECMHMAANENLNGFYRAFSRHLNLFYSEFFKEFLKLKSVDNKKIDEVIKYLRDFERGGPRYINNNLSQYYRFLESQFKEDSNLTEQDFAEVLTQMIVACKLFIVSIPAFERNIRRFRMVFTTLDLTYQRAFGEKNQYTTPIQELFSISEVACVYSEMRPQDSVIRRIFKLIK